MFIYRHHWNEVSIYVSKTVSAATYISIVIPARNESNNIGKLLNDIIQQEYNKELLEVIVIDDHSEDNTYEVVKKISEEFSFIKIYRLHELISDSTSAYKKQAISEAVKL